MLDKCANPPCAARLRYLHDGQLFRALVQLIGDIKAARTASASDAEVASARGFQWRAQFYLDFVEAENSMGFHAPGEALRILAESIDYSRQGQVALNKRRFLFTYSPTQPKPGCVGHPAAR